MSIYHDYIPYFYVIQDVCNGIYYAGSKWSKSKSRGVANPSTFMIEGGYTTSSETINELISQYGLNNFVIRKIRTFETAEEAYGYETRFLRKVDARNHPRFYNEHNNDGAMDTGKMRTILKQRYGIENVSQVPKFKQKISEGIKRTKNSNVWKTTKGVVAKERLSQKLNNEEWKLTKGKEKSKKLSEMKKGKYTGKDNSNYGNYWNEEMKARMSKMHSGENHPQYGWFWINNGNEEKKVSNDYIIPINWKRGRAKKNRKELIDEFLNSGMSRKEFAKMKNINYNTMKKYLRGYSP